MSQLVFVVVFGITAILGERQSCIRFGGVITCLVGVVIAAWQADLQSTKRKTLDHGEDMVYVGLYCFLVAIFQVAVKRSVGGAGRHVGVVWLFTGLMGVVTVLALWPGLVVLHALRIEKMEAPPKDDWPMIGFISMLYLFHNACSIIGIALTSPLTVGVVKALAIPLTFLADLLRKRHHPTSMEIFGAGLIVCGFIATMLSKDIIDDLDFSDVAYDSKIYTEDDRLRSHLLVEETDSDLSDDERYNAGSPSLRRRQDLYDSDDDLTTEY